MLLSGIKIGIDRLDARFDRSIWKRTIPVAYGTGGATRAAATVFVVTTLTTAAVVGSVAVRPGAVVRRGSRSLVSSRPRHSLRRVCGSRADWVDVRLRRARVRLGLRRMRRTRGRGWLVRWSVWCRWFVRRRQPVSTRDCRSLPVREREVDLVGRRSQLVEYRAFTPVSGHPMSGSRHAQRTPHLAVDDQRDPDRVDPR